MHLQDRLGGWAALTLRNRTSRRRSRTSARRPRRRSATTSSRQECTSASWTGSSAGRSGTRRSRSGRARGNKGGRKVNLGVCAGVIFSLHNIFGDADCNWLRMRVHKSTGANRAWLLAHACLRLCTNRNGRRSEFMQHDEFRSFQYSSMDSAAQWIQLHDEFIKSTDACGSALPYSSSPARLMRPPFQKRHLEQF